MRKAIVTRTIGFTVCTVMALDTKAGEVKTVRVNYTGNATDDAKILKELQKSWTDNDVALVKIINKETKEQLYGMTEEMFIQYATPMDSRTTKI